MKFVNRRIVLGLALAFGGISCSGEGTLYKLPNDTFIVAEGDARTQGSVPEGNLMATAIQQVHELDVVLYPSLLLRANAPTLLRKGMSPDEVKEFLKIYPNGTKDQFIVGTLSGREIMSFVEARARENYNVDLQVAGLRYHIHYTGGWKIFANFEGERGAAFESEKIFRVAISKFYYFSGQTFPSYKYRNGLGLQNFVETKFISAKESLRTYLHSARDWPFLNEPRAKVSKTVLNDLGVQAIAKIQGPGHRSPLLGHQVTTKGLVTAVGSLEWYPGGEEAYIQSQNPDGDPATSEGLHLSFGKLQPLLKLGDEIEVKGTVYEQVLGAGLGRTGLGDITSVKILRRGVPLPAPIVLGIGGRAIPQRAISTYRGNLNFKPRLELTEGIDFWEALEGMRITIANPRVVGFRGGNEDFDGSPKGHLQIYFIPDGDRQSDLRTDSGGIVIDEANGDFNPEVIQVQSNHFSKGIATDVYYRVGDQLQGQVHGVLGYEANIFGGGEYAIVVPEEQETLTQYSASSSVRTEFEHRPITSLVATERELTVAAYNIENLAGSQRSRVRELGKSISVNLKCPDILSLVEIQDNNATDFAGGSGAAGTMEQLIADIECPGVIYKPLNIDPVANGEGGQPGGNIRVAMIYNSVRVSFTPRGAAGALTETRVLADGSLDHNPGRVFPNDPVFQGTRRSLAAEFVFRGQKIFVIANHFNSKLGDQSLWAAEQPAVLGSEAKRKQLAEKINFFVKLLLHRNSAANVIVLGDFNAYLQEEAMSILAGRELQNLMLVDGLVSPQNRYTTNFNGNSQAIDFIFVSLGLLNRSPALDIPHINSDYMGRLSDHDPVISRFRF